MGAGEIFPSQTGFVVEILEFFAAWIIYTGLAIWCGIVLLLAGGVAFVVLAELWNFARVFITGDDSTHRAIVNRRYEDAMRRRQWARTSRY